MVERLDSAIVRRIIEIGSDDPLMLLLVTYVGAAFHASLFGGIRAFLVPHEQKVYELICGPPTNASLRHPDLRIAHRVAHQLELVYRLAVFDSFITSLTSYALAARPVKAIGSAQMPVGVLLGKTRSFVVNEHIAKRTKSLSRESFGVRIQALREISEVDLVLSENDLGDLRKLSNLRNAIVHEGATFQFTVDDDLRIHPHAQTQTVTITSQKFDVINRIAAAIYEQYVTKFIARELSEPERVLVAGLCPPS
jgi:hypothetical protein